MNAQGNVALIYLYEHREGTMSTAIMPIKLMEFLQFAN